MTLQVEQVERIKALLATGCAAGVSGFVKHAVGVALDDSGSVAKSPVDV